MHTRFTLLIMIVLAVAGCKNNAPKQQPPDPWFDSIPFGTVQPLLTAHGEKILRIDSMVESTNTTSIYFLTDKGSRRYDQDHLFHTIVSKGYKPDGGHSCVGQESGNGRTVHRCYDSACTLVIDTIELPRTKRPYPILHPELDSICTPCPPIKK